MPEHKGLSRGEVSLRAKIGALAGITLVALAAIGTTYFLTSGRMNAANDLANTASEQAALYAAANADARRLLQASEALYLSPSEARVANVAALADLVEEHGQILSTDAEVSALLAPLPAAAHRMTEAVVALGLNQDLGLQGALRGAVHEIETLIKAEVEMGKPLDGLLVEMLTLRRNEKDLMLREDPKYIDTFGATLERFNSVLAGFGDPALSAAVSPWPKAIAPTSSHLPKDCSRPRRPSPTSRQPRGLLLACWPAGWKRPMLRSWPRRAGQASCRRS